MVTEREKSVATEDPINNKPAELEKGDTASSDDSEVAAPSSSHSLSPEKALVQSHPLEHFWTFWFKNPSAKSKKATWGSSIRPIYTFSTVEEFWSLYNNMPHPSKLAVGADFYCFKRKIEPKWEDPICSNGGKWGLQFSQKESDTPWLYTLLAMIGEQFDHGDEICGAVVSIRAKQERIGLWTMNAADEVAQVSIGRQWKQFLDYNDNIGFIFHDDAKELDRNAMNRYTV